MRSPRSSTTCRSRRSAAMLYVRGNSTRGGLELVSTREYTREAYRFLRGRPFFDEVVFPGRFVAGRSDGMTPRIHSGISPSARWTRLPFTKRAINRYGSVGEELS